MTNLIISRKCNQSCPYCFAGDDSNQAGPVFISIEDFERRLDYLDRSDIAQARFLGGEPTLHPRFAELIQRAQARNKLVIIFTNGWMPEPALAALEALPADQCSVVINISSEGKSARGQGKGAAVVQRRAVVLKRLGQKAQIGINLYRIDQDLNPYIDLVRESGCKPSIRVGLAQPILEGRNAHLPVRDYPRIGMQLAQFAELAARARITIEMDCGFVRCMFSDEAVKRLADLGADLGWRCSPILDIDTDGKVFHCFPLSGKYWSWLEPAAQAADLRKMFEKQTELFRQAGIYKECSNCPYKLDQTCSGGCLANTIPRFSQTSIDLTIHR